MEITVKELESKPLTTCDGSGFEYLAGFEHGREVQEEIDNELLDQIMSLIYEYEFDENINAKLCIQNIRKLVDRETPKVRYPEDVEFIRKYMTNEEMYTDVELENLWEQFSEDKYFASHMSLWQGGVEQFEEWLEDRS